jgi:hypothetical protein
MCVAFDLLALDDVDYTPVRSPRDAPRWSGPHTVQGVRFRHTTQFVRWRPDRDPTSCGFGQLAEPVPFDVTQVLARPSDLTRLPWSLRADVHNIFTGRARRLDDISTTASTNGGHASLSRIAPQCHGLERNLVGECETAAARTPTRHP